MAETAAWQETRQGVTRVWILFDVDWKHSNRAMAENEQN